MQLYKVSKIVKIAQEKMGKEGTTDHLHLVYRCYSCARLITKLEVLEARAAGQVELCPCGSKMVRPTNAKIWEEIFLPRCWALIYAYYMKKIAPPPPPPTEEENDAAKVRGMKATRAFEQQLVQNVRKRRGLR